MMIDEILASRSRQHRPGYYTRMVAPPHEMFELFTEFKIPISDFEIYDWSKDLKEKVLNGCYNALVRDTHYYNLKQLYLVSQSDIVRNSLKDLCEYDIGHMRDDLNQFLKDNPSSDGRDLNVAEKVILMGTSTGVLLGLYQIITMN